jgi:hypothetical protein
MNIPANELIMPLIIFISIIGVATLVVYISYKLIFKPYFKQTDKVKDYLLDVAKKHNDKLDLELEKLKKDIQKGE